MSTYDAANMARAMIHMEEESEWDVVSYVREEVARQGHNVKVLDGIERVGWMLNAWAYALERSGRFPIPLIGHAEMLGRLVEPGKNTHGFRDCRVRVGDRTCPPPEEVLDRLSRVFEMAHTMKPLEFYREYELVHPFVDGNGRSGKILMNWRAGTLLKPTFPPRDFWGRAIRNP